MKENTKYHDYRFIGKINVDESQPWFDFASTKPWDEGELPWTLDNKVRREILIKLAESPKTFDEIHDCLNFSPKPLIISKEEYDCKVNFQWSKATIENHLMALEWYDLIKQNGDKYELMFPILNIEKLTDIDKYVIKFAENWVNIIRELKNEINENIGALGDKTHLYQVLIEKAVDKLHDILKSEGMLPMEPNIKALWAEQLRKIKFNEWVKRTF
ncbi:MAG: hypothetical protein ACTSRI_11175 [Promethearchaeota archaeon]